MGKRTIWKQAIVPEARLSSWLTTHNLQPNKFKLLHMQPGTVIVVYIEKEIANVE